MRHAAIYSVVFTLISLGAQSASAQIAWEGKLRDAHTKAKQQGKLMLLHFYTDNCIYCDRLEAGAFRSAAVSQSINDNFVPVKVHGIKNESLAKMFKVTKYPTDVIVTTDGKALSHSVSPQQPDRYIAMLTDAQVNYAKSRTQIASHDQPTAVANSTAAGFAAANVGSTGAAAAQAASTQMAANEMPVQIPSMGVPTITPNAPNPTAAVASMSRENQFVMPTTAADVTKTPGVQASLASARSTGLSLPASDVAAMTKDAMKHSAGTSIGLPSSDSTTKPELAIQGYCAVAVVNKGEWIEGKPELGVIHLGKLYLFSDKASMELFLSDPVPFTPMLNEIDVVRFFEEKRIVPGKREWGVIDPVHNRMFFFADEASMLHFEEHFDRYLEASIEVMDYAIEVSNPGV
ncbi:MAG: DUF255 domain-containing protein [Planctomycetales bacterium]|nr:DUF255 domain-containing protein [Planctomycetales bacterium]